MTVNFPSPTDITWEKTQKGGGLDLNIKGT